ncbi:MAG: Gldg family protein [Bacteroidia bacterium]|nr:Gldg family protein [Bacteroidia bacterium]
MQKQLVTILWLVGIVVMINLLSRDFFLRLDLTEDQTYTLSQATKDIIRDLEEPVTVTAYFTENLPPQYGKGLSDFKNLLKEYSTRSGGMVNYEFIDPNDDQVLEQQAIQNGIQPLLINVREKNEVVQKKAFMGAQISQNELSDIIPFVSPDGPMEYNLTTSIKKVSVAAKPTIGIVQGHGEPGFEQIAQVYQSLSILYEIENVDLSNPVPQRHRAVLLLNPVDSIPPVHFTNLETYLNQGGNIAIAVNHINGNFQTMQAEENSTGLGSWLNTKGISLGKSLVIDATCSAVTVQQRQGFFTVNSQVEFPYFPRITSFGDHPIVKGLDQIAFPFVSPVNFNGDSSLAFTPILQTSERSAIKNLPVVFNVQQQWQQADFPLGPQTLAGVVQGDFGGDGSVSRLVVFGDGDFPIAQGQTQGTADNFSLLVNAIDWLSDDTGLIDLRTKGVSSRPIEEMEEAKMIRIKWTNFLLPILIAIGYGIFRRQKNQQIRKRRMEESYV